MKFLTLAAAALAGVMAVSGPAQAHDRHEGWRNDRGHHYGWDNGRHGRKHWKRHHQRCWTEWRHHRRVRVCR